MVSERVLVAQLRSIAEKGPLFPGDTLSHEATNECGRRGYAQRDKDGNWVATVAGGAYLHSPFVRAAELLPLVEAHVDELRRLLGEAVHVFVEPVLMGQTGAMTGVLAHGPDFLRRVKEAFSPSAQKHSTRLTAEAVDSGSNDYSALE